MNMNFGGFIPASTVDWRGKAVSVVFFRGCPARCFYCHNPELLEGLDIKPVEEVVEMIKWSHMITSGVVFSGGEPTKQRDALVELATRAKALGLLVAIHTNGMFPTTLTNLIEEKLVDKISLDIKTTWGNYDNLLKGNFWGQVRESLIICRYFYWGGQLPSFEAVITLFRGREQELPIILKDLRNIDVVIQQGVSGAIKPFSESEMIEIAQNLGREVKIRTREGGEKTVKPIGYTSIT